MTLITASAESGSISEHGPTTVEEHAEGTPE
jgi:hypothetical protein